MPIAVIVQPIVDACQAILEFWHNLLGDFEGSWGVAIILLTFTVRLAILPLTFKGVKGMQRMQTLQPEIKRIQERYKDDKQRLNQEVMAFYQREKVNPLGSCLPLILQIPFFISLFYLLRSDSFQEDIAGNASFGPIPDLAEPLTGHTALLVFMIVLYVGTQLIATMITSIGGDKTQQRIMFALPFVFVIPIINFQAGLIVYWITTNIWTIGQQLVVRKLYPRPDVNGGSDSTAGAAVPAGAAAVAANGASSKAPPTSPRKKKKRSGRRR